MAERKIIPVASEPENLITLAEAYGADCSHIEFSQIYSFEPEELAYTKRPVLSVFFLFPIGSPDGPIEKRHKNDTNPLTICKNPSKIPFFTYQIVGDLCGTIAMIHNIANNKDVMKIKDNSWMSRFMNDTKDMTPLERGQYIDKSIDLFELHNKNAVESTAPFVDGKCDTHFACFTEVGGILWELDGRKPYPIYHGPCTDVLLQSFDVITKEFFPNLSPEDQLRTSIIAMSQI